MPVVAAARLKGNIVHTYLTGGNRCQIALSDKILGVCHIRLANRENHGCCMTCLRCFFVICTLCAVSLRIIFLRIICLRTVFLCIVCLCIAFAYLPYFLCQIECCPALGPSCIKSNMGDNGCDFLLGHPMFFCIHKVELQRRIRNTGCHQGYHGNNASGLYINVLIVPVFSK